MRVYLHTHLLAITYHYKKKFFRLFVFHLFRTFFSRFFTHSFFVIGIFRTFDKIMIIVFFSFERHVTKLRRRNRTKEEVECNQSPPICIYLLQSLVPRSPVTIFWRNLYIFLYESYRARVLDIRKHASEQNDDREIKKKKKANTRVR